MSIEFSRKTLKSERFVDYAQIQGGVSMVNIDNLFKMISERGITQSKLAENTSISTGNISDWKKGKSMPSAIKLDELATYFNCSVDYLLGRTDEPKMVSNSGTSINQQHIAGDANASIANATKKPADSISEKFMEIFNSLPFEEQVEIMNIAIKKSKNEGK